MNRKEVFPGDGGLWYFRTKAANNEITSRCSESYPSQSAAIAGAEADQRANEGAEIKVVEK